MIKNGKELSELQDALAWLCVREGYVAAATHLAQNHDEQDIFDLAMANIAVRANVLAQS